MFPNHLLKFRRARHHLDEFRRHVRNWFNEADSHSEWAEDDPDDPNQILIKARAKQIPAEPFSLIIGDVVQNFRNCLDHLAFELASAYTNPLPEEIASDSQFPIIGDVNRKGQSGQGPEMFNRQRHRIRGIDPAAQAIIESVQPYHRRNEFRDDRLWQLASLSNTDKHRVLHLATIYPHAFTFDPGAGQTYPILTIRNTKGLTFSYTGTGVGESEAVIARIGVARVDDPNVNVKLEIAPSVAFADGIAVHEDIMELLELIETDIIIRIIDPLRPYL